MISCKDPEFTTVFPRPADTTGDRLRHVLALYVDSPDELEMVVGTVDAYEQGCTTALTLGDLRAINATLEATAADLRSATQADGPDPLLMDALTDAVAEWKQKS